MCYFFKKRVEACQNLTVYNLFFFLYFKSVDFARPDSVMDGVSVYKARLAMGEALANTVCKKLGKTIDIDVVIPVCWSMLC